MNEYHDQDRTARTAWSAVKHTHEKVGEHWEPKDHNGPSDERADHKKSREARKS